MPEPEGTTLDGGGIIPITPTENGAPNNPEAATPANEGTPEGTPAPKTFTQEEVNALLAKQKREERERVEKLRSAGLSDDEIKLIEKKETVTSAEEDLVLVRQERVELIIDRNKDIVSKLSADQVSDLKKSSPEQVQKFFDGLSAVLGKPSETPATPAAAPTGVMPDMSGGPQSANIPQEDLAMAEGIQSGIQTGNWGPVVSGLFKEINK